jgi:hypothetical protein
MDHIKQQPSLLNVPFSPQMAERKNARRVNISVVNGFTAEGGNA